MEKNKLGKNMKKEAKVISKTIMICLQKNCDRNE